ncbi:serine hydrolase [Leptobacterium flavescens]|uniref:Serine hydrolase n=1 Tax=Leptobacterium flavescens TaxID=472055 RepID=A0A6P0UIK5_9FLAO|nr:serine hydrolase domain-containing protein [Leptobacterium flavescens]NER12280.1 serine hydrolase [Leptobacterium flavescens]
MKRFVTLLFLLLTFPVFSQISEDVKSEIRKRVDTGINPSIVLGVWTPQSEDYYVYGYADKEKNVKAGEETLYEIGSITKTFTALLLARYVDEGSIKLSDAVDSFLPDGIRLRDDEGNVITLEQLSTHTSGLPRLPNNMKSLYTANPYQDYGRKELFEFLKSYKAGNIGKDFAYSNLAVGLLGEALALHKKGDYKELIQKDILDVLGLKNTYFEIPEEAQSKFATGYAGEKPTSAWDFQAIAAAGALRADIRDLVKYGRSYLDKGNSLKSAMELTSKPYFTDKNGLGHGLGWFINPGEILVHNGGTGGFRTFISIDKTNQKIVAIMTNSGSNPTEDIAIHLMNPEKNKLIATKDEQDLSEEDLNTYTGSFENSQYGLNYLLSLKEGKLFAKLGAQDAFQLFYEGDDTFFYKVVKAKVSFQRNDNKEITGLTLLQNGQEIPFTKK